MWGLLWWTGLLGWWAVSMRCTLDTIASLPLRPRRLFLWPARLAAVPCPLGEFRPFSFRAGRRAVGNGRTSGKERTSGRRVSAAPEPAAAAAADTETTTRRAFVNSFFQGLIELCHYNLYGCDDAPCICQFFFSRVNQNYAITIYMAARNVITIYLF